jgi:hypothetical protein
MKRLLYTLIFVILIIAVFIVLLITNRHKVFFRPDTRFSIPHEYEEFHLPETGSHVIRVTPSDPEGSPIVAAIYFHGNAGNISWSIPQIKEIANTFGCDIYCLDYPHYGKSLNRVELNEANIYKSGDELVKYVKAGKDIPLLLIGHSLGGCVASRCATQHNCPYLVTINSPTSFSQVTEDIMPPGLKWISWFVTEFPSYLDLQKYTGRGLLIHCPDDELVSFTHSQNAVQHNTHLSLIAVEGKHNTPNIKWNEVKDKLLL